MSPSASAHVSIERRPFGRHPDLVSILGLGGYHLGRTKTVTEAVRIVHAAIDAGVNFLDNAWEYHEGESERRVGRDVLIGAVAAVARTALYQVLITTMPQLRGDRSASLDVGALMGIRHLIATLVLVVADALANSMIVVLIYSLLVMVRRRAWAATLVVLVAMIVPTILQVHASPLELVVLAIALPLYVQ